MGVIKLSEIEKYNPDELLNILRGEIDEKNK